MTARTQKLLLEINRLHSIGWERKEIAQKLGITLQYARILLRNHEKSQSCVSHDDYGLSTRVLNCLKRNNIPLDLQVIADSIYLLLHMRGIGDSALNEIGSTLLTHRIIDDIEEWKEDGKRLKHIRRDNYTEMISRSVS